MKIVISYTPNQTRELAFQLRDALQTVENIEVWIDESQDENLDRVHRLQEAIREGDLLLVLVTPDINRTALPPSLLMMDVLYAQQQGKELLPILALNTHIPKELDGLPLHDLTQNRSAGIRKVVADVRERTGQGNTDTIRLEKRRGEMKDFLDEKS